LPRLRLGRRRQKACDEAQRGRGDGTAHAGILAHPPLAVPPRGTIAAAGEATDPTSRPEWFTTAFFHHPQELKAEVQESGLRLEDLVGLEGPTWLLRDVDG
jgi:hypothetical protein